MMAKRLPSILPPLSLAESLETTQVHSVAGKLGKNMSLISQRPFRSPHHTISQVALVGGGMNPQPGEISLAHNGVLFADELPEFNKSTLEMLRQPLEDRKITISRAKYTIEYPCSFMFVASMNRVRADITTILPPLCVHAGTDTALYEQNQRSASRPHRHTDRDNARALQGHISCSTGREQRRNTRKGYQARHIQEERFRECKGVHCNAQMSERMIHQYAEPGEDGIEMLRMAMERLNLRTCYNRHTEMARTIADLRLQYVCSPQHLAEAISYRNLDRSDWAERGGA